MPEMTDSVTVHIDATPAEVWDLVSDVTKIGRYSPETFEAEWTDGSTGPEVGATFRGHVKRNEKGPVYWAPCFVTESVPAHAVGTALTIQTSIGFLLTTITIQLVPPLVEIAGWRWAFVLLALGPAAGIWSIRRLVAWRRRPQA